MAENSGIEWTTHTFNGWMGCTKVSPACENCYAERDMDHRWNKVRWGPNGNRVMTSEANWRKPLAWDRKAAESGIRPRVFCSSLSDVFEHWDGPITQGGEIVCRPYLEAENVPEMWNTCSPEDLQNDPQGWSAITMNDVRRRLFALIDATPNLDWLLLTKRPENIKDMWHGDERENVWLGCSVENQEYARKRIPLLQEARGLAPVLFLSCEPLVGQLDLSPYLSGLDWAITGGESGPMARPAHSDWYRQVRDQCKEHDVPFHFKQWGEWAPGIDTGENRAQVFVTLDGDTGDDPTKWSVDAKPEQQIRIGKKAAGRLLDGVTHDGAPIHRKVVSNG